MTRVPLRIAVVMVALLIVMIFGYSAWINLGR